MLFKYTTIMRTTHDQCTEWSVYYSDDDDDDDDTLFNYTMHDDGDDDIYDDE